MAIGTSTFGKLSGIFVKKIRRATIAAGFIAVAALSAMSLSSISAETLNPANLPAKTHWLIFINSQELVKTGMAKKMESMAHDMQQYAPKHNARMRQQKAKMKKLWNSLCKESSDITFYGIGVGNDQWVIQMHVNPATFHAAPDLQAHTTGKTVKIGSYTARQMLPNAHGPMFYVVRPATNEVIITRKIAAMKAAINFMSKKQPALTANSVLLGNMKPDVIFYAAGMRFDQLSPNIHLPPFITHLNNVDIAIATTNARTAHLRLTLAGTNKAVAQNLYKMVEGGLAMAQMMGQSQNATAEAKLHAMMLSTLKVSRKGRVISAHWALPMDMLEQSIQDHLAAMRDSHWQHWKHHQDPGPAH